MRWGALAVGVVTIVTAGVLSGPFDSVRDRLPFLSNDPDPVVVVGVEATSSADGGAPGLAVDGQTATAWVEGAPGSGVGEVVTVSFGQPVEVGWIGFILGERIVDGTTRPRLHQVRVTFDGGTLVDVTLEDRPDFQSFAFTPRTTTSATIEILTVRDGRDNEDASVAEIEFFGP